MSRWWLNHPARHVLHLTLLPALLLLSLPAQSMQLSVVICPPRFPRLLMMLLPLALLQIRCQNQANQCREELHSIRMKIS